MTFILVCLSAGIIMLIERILTAGSVPMTVGCIVCILIALFGIVALIRGMFQKLHTQKEKSSSYTLSAVVMTIGILVGLIIGVVSSF